MGRLLTIALPTFNRAALLERQLAWIAQAVRGLESYLQVIISDNASTDATRTIIDRWCGLPNGVALTIKHQATNIGAVRNIVYCIRAAAGRYVWTISDDDPIDDGAVAYVIGVLTKRPDLALLILNFSSRDVRSGRLLFERCFDVPEDTVWPKGQEIFERYLAYSQSARWGGLALTTALVYRADLARRALREWPTGLDNRTVQLYVTAFCAQHGPTKVTQDNHLECAAGTHYFLQDDKVRLCFRYAEVAEAFVRLMELGYAKELCRRKVLEQSNEFRRRFLIRCFRRWPLLTTRVLVRYCAAVRRVRGHLTWWELLSLLLHESNRHAPAHDDW